MIACDNCLYTQSHPLGLTFHENICSGCITHKEKNNLNWDNQLEVLKEILKKKKKKSKTYDCVVPVLGDAEDYFVLKNILDLGLSPLVVSVNDYFKNDIGWYNLQNLTTYFDVDSIVYNPEINSYKELIRVSLRKYNHMLLPFLQLHTSFPVHIASQRNIPLIVWGQCQAVEQVGKFSHLDYVEMSEWSRLEHDLFNVDVERLIGNGAQIDERNLNFYSYPSIKKIGKSGLQGLYLSNFLRWDPLKQNAASCDFGFIPQKQTSTFDPFERAGSSVYYEIHDLLKLRRVGYGKVKDQLSREIRHFRLSRTSANACLEQFNSRKFYIKPFFEWLGVTKSGYDWFKKFRLQKFSHFITEDRSFEGCQLKLERVDPCIEEAFDRAQLPSESFIMFGKGVYI